MQRTHSQAAHAPAAAGEEYYCRRSGQWIGLDAIRCTQGECFRTDRALAGKSQVSEMDLDAALRKRVNSASEGNHSHGNKTVLDQIEQADLDKPRRDRCGREQICTSHELRQ